MMKKNILSIAAFFLIFASYAQALSKQKIYGTMLLTHAEKLQESAPQGDVEIVYTKGNEAVVYMTLNASEHLNYRSSTHGPGFLINDSKEEAIANLKENNTRSLETYQYTITEDALVNTVYDKVNIRNIENLIKDLENYKTRYHTTEKARESAEGLLKKWRDIIKEYGRTEDISVELFEHDNSITPMPSVVLTIKGSETPEEHVIIGGHLDSTVNRGDKNNAPGADDNASGISVITEAFRCMLEIGFKPKRSVKLMAYAAEEVGLKGSRDIAKQYKNRDIKVVAVGQFDMTNYKGSAKDIYFISDYVSKDLNKFMQKLLDHYNGPDSKYPIKYGESKCGYGCSDHASWTEKGYPSAFPFEATFSGANPKIHTKNDTFESSGDTAKHSLNFCYLACAFVIEIAKGEALSVDKYSQEGYDIKIFKNALRYNVESTKPAINGISIYNVEGKKVGHHTIAKKTGKVTLKNLSSGTYIARITLSNNKSFSKKFVLN